VEIHETRILTISKDNFLIFITRARLNTKGGFLWGTVKRNTPDWPGIHDKSNSVRCFDISDVVHVQVGFIGTRKFESGVSKNTSSKVLMDESAYVSIIYRGHESLDLVIPNREDREAFFQALSHIRQVYEGNKYVEGSEQLLLRYIWYGVDADKNGYVNEKELKVILNRLNYHLKDSEVKKRYMKYIKDRAKGGKDKSLQKEGITFEQCMDFLQTLKGETSAAYLIWDSIFGKDVDTVSANTFLNDFMKKKQHESDTEISDVQVLFKYLNELDLTYAGEPPSDMEGSIDRARFESFLFGQKNEMWDPDRLRLNQASLDKPMSHYWVNTSHNTYLTGDQLKSESSVQMYMAAMQRGCKCLELDCWDGENDNSGVPVPVVYHGHTLTSKITFSSIIRCVKGYMDSDPNTYPMILSLENHCSHPFQEVMAKVLKETLGHLLYVPDKETLDKDLPSPEALRGKVVIKGKRPPEPDDAPDDEADSSDGEEEEKEVDGKKDDKKDKPKKVKVLPVLANLTLLNGTHYKSFEISKTIPPSSMHSIGESKITKILDKSSANVPLWREYNVNHLTRTYPAGVRVNSSNYNPTLAWSVGCQLVALNFQTNDSNMLMNDGRFKENGGCGYVLKPANVMGEEPGESLFKSGMKLKIRVIGGTGMPKPGGNTTGETIDPYVRVTVHDVLAEKNSKATEEDQDDWTSKEHHETPYINDNGFCPVWDEKSFKEFEVQAPNVAMVVFAVLDKDTGFDDRLAAAAVPVSCLRRGIRSLTLSDYHGKDWGPFDFVHLLVEIDF